MSIPKEVKQWAAKIGRKGGKAKTKAKAKAAKANGAKGGRPRKNATGLYDALADRVAKSKHAR